ncbi:acidic mammalian chitinase-like [Tribolium madens]|uniref:acidic mammalian chitinase-like n=1 Tax=Tribolium madens TaxID=41895 RepID=UPI001CF72F72|nr:acidic mammalian chitinase-like [Tribolium madens]
MYKVICYYASWGATRPGNGKFLPEDIDATLCTHVNYAFLGLNRDGSLQILDEENDINQEGLKRVSDLKKINPDLRVLLSIGGAAADTGTFTEVARSADLSQAMANSAIEFFEKFDFDGLDVDWEYPRGGDIGTYIDLLTVLKKAFEPKGYLLTVAVNSIPGEVGGYDIPAMSNILDVINVMTYDFHAMWGNTAENSPLYGGENESQWNRDNRNSDAAIRYWLDGGADPQKIALGIAFYGHTYKISPENHGLDAPTQGPGDPGPYTNNTFSLGYNEVCEFHPDGSVVFLDDMKVPYMYDGDFWIGYDNEQSVTIKTEYAKEKNLAGVFIWSIETDDLHGFCGEKNGLLKAINQAIKS